MKVIIQRVIKASVLIDSKEERKIEKGMVILLGISKNDTMKDIDYLIKKIPKLRIFSDDNDKMNLSINDINGEILLISQFTLYSNVKDGNRPSFEESMKYESAKELYNDFIYKLKNTNIKFKIGEFGSEMKVSLINDGPVTIIIDTKE